MTESNKNLKNSDIGYISAINGSLIEIKGLEHQIKLHDLIKIASHGIIGEVIHIHSDHVVAQCFENLYNLKLFEKVINLHEPLSMELAPGLLSNIFDGIQRPLKEIFINSKGLGFMERGIEIPSLSRKKKWHFIPTSKLNEKLSGGDVVGTVQETPLIEHKIMIPPRHSGILSYIVDEGDCTIIDEIYRLKNGKNEVALNMMQKWPVTTNRPYLNRISPNQPLYTGIRTIDLLFPIAMGGTVAVPGGFGTGKCITGETPILISNGGIVEIKELFKRYCKQDSIIELDNKEETLIRLRKKIDILSFNGINFEKRSATHIYRGKTDKLVRITTRTGRKIEITPVHKLFAFNGKKIQGVESKSIKIGDFITVPRKINIVGHEIVLNPYDFDISLRVVDKKALNQMVCVLNLLKNKMTLKELAEKLEMSYDVLRWYYQRKNKPTLQFLQKLTKLARIPPIDVRLLKSERQSKSFKFPRKITKELAEWLGLFTADGHIKGEYGGVYLYNNSKQILERFKLLSKRIFDLTAKYGKDEDKTPYMRISNTTLVKFLYFLGIPKENKTYKISIPNCLLKSPENILIHFFNGYFAGDGWFHKYTVGFSTVSKKLYSDLSYLHSRLGILYRVKKRNNSYYFYIEGKHSEKLANIMQNEDVYIYDKIKPLYEYSDKNINHFDGLDIIPVDKQVLITLKSQGKDSEGYNLFRKVEGIRLRNYIESDEKISLTMLSRIYNLVIKNKQKFDNEILCHIKNLIETCKNVYFDKVVKIEALNKEIDVYDLTVEGLHNFIGGITPFILHNTVIQQSLAKWCNADVIVFVGCGERGNEMADVLKEFTKIIDPKSGRPLLERIILIANTSNMPVSAREASIFSGVTMAEYYRDMGYNVAVLADSTSRWAESLREISGLLEEMPAEEGYPAYLPSKLSSFYERAGVVKTIGNSASGKDNLGSLTIIGSVSPPAGDFSEPVTATTKRFVQAYWALDANLAYSKHYPAINWLDSYSNYPDYISEWYYERDIDWPEIDIDWFGCRNRVNEILSKEVDLKNITQLIGEENLPEEQRLILFISRLIREGFLIQNAFDNIDNYTDIKKLLGQIKLILLLNDETKELLKQGFFIEDIKNFEVINDILRVSHSVPNSDFDQILNIKDKLLKEIQSLKLTSGGIKR